MPVAGIDIGSVSSKIVALGEDGDILFYGVTDTRPDTEGVARYLMTQALDRTSLHLEDFTYIVSTGYGRVTVSFAQENRTEIVCHALGAHLLFRSARTIIDIGGQDTKIIRINEEGRVKQFVMNERCAAGTGRFTEVMARALGIDSSEWGNVVNSAQSRAKISSMCTVFAESEVISQIAQKVPVSNIVAGVCESIVTRVIQLSQKMGPLEKDVVFTGGVARNKGIVQILEEKLADRLLIPEIPQITGALGAALIARRYKK